VGCFPGGASYPYEVEELSGNVWEWTRSVYAAYPYPADGVERAQREDLQASEEARRVLRGGSFLDYPRNVRGAYRLRFGPRYADFNVGFRVVMAVLP
jgi:formylglycine-generating enzyme required for sulfatase activity